MILKVGTDLKWIKDASYQPVKDLSSKDSLSLIPIFLADANINEVKEDSELLCKLICILWKKNLPDETMEKVERVFSKVLYFDQEKTPYFTTEYAEKLFADPHSYPPSRVMCDLKTFQQILPKDPIDKRDEWGLTLLMQASLNNRPELVNALLAMKADPDLTCQGYTTFHWACLAGYLPIVELLANLPNFKIDEKADYEGTPLMIACKNGHAAVVHFLVDHGADKNAVDSLGWTPLHHACNRLEENLFIIENVVTDKNLNLKNSSGTTPLMFACGNSLYKTVLYLLEKKAEERAVDSDAQAPLHYACMGSDVEVVKLFIKTPKDANQPDIRETRPLMFACEAPIVSYLLQIGADPALSDKWGSTALHKACEKGILSIVKELAMRKDFNVDVQDEDGTTPLMTACEEEHKEVVQFLVEQGANKNLEDSVHNQTALHCACQSKDVAIARMVATKDNINKPHGSKWTPLALACGLDKNVETVNFLIEEGADVSLVPVDLAQKELLPLWTKPKGEVSVKTKISLLEHFLPMLELKELDPLREEMQKALASDQLQKLKESQELMKFFYQILKTPEKPANAEAQQVLVQMIEEATKEEFQQIAGLFETLQIALFSFPSI